MKKKILIVLGILLIVAGVVFLIFRGQDNGVNTADTIHEASEGTGFIGEKVVGNPDNAKLVIYEYADYGCSHCAEWNRRVNDLLKKYGDEIALVFRAYDIGLFSESATVFGAATAAQIQGYFKEYKDLLFNNQSEWGYTEVGQLENILVKYFEEASNGKGDVEKFRSDLRSDAVRKRVNFEQRMGERAKVKGTPTFRIDGEKIELGTLTETIEQKML